MTFSADLDNKYTPGTKQKRKSGFSKSLINSIQQYELRDVWRTRNLQREEFTFYSYSRLDMSWTTADILLDTRDIDTTSSHIRSQPNYMAPKF